MDGGKMEGIIINHQKRRTKFEGEVPKGYEVHHIIPYCLCGDDSQENLKLIKWRDHKKISGENRKIVNKLKKRGLIEPVTHYSMEIKVPLNVIKKEFLRLKNEQ